MPSRRIKPLLVFLALAILLGSADRAAAEPPQCNPGDPDCGPIITHQTITHTLTVTRPSQGTITSSPAGISCPAGSGGDCTQSDSQTLTCVDGDCPDPNPAAWDSYTLSASGGPSGFAASWSGSCSGATCAVKLDLNRSAALTWIDVTNPTVTVSPSSVKVGKTLNATAVANDNAAVASVEFFLDGVPKATDTAAPYGAAIPMDGFAQGSAHTLLARATDTSGRTADSSSTVTVDKVVNLTAGTVPAFTNAATVPLTIGTDADAALKCSLNGGAPGSCSGSFSPVSAASPDGSYTYAVTATDDVGNVASATRAFVLDRTAPAITDFDGPSEGGQVTTDAVAITYHVADANPDAVACTLDGAATPCDAAGAALAGLADGSHAFTVTATDKAGNVGSKVRSFSVLKASTPPADPGSSSSGSSVVVAAASNGPALTGGAPLAANPATVRYGFTRHGAKTTFTRLSIAKLPAGATVKATCKGGGCPKQTVTLTKSAGVSAFLKHKLSAGAVVQITISKPGMATKTVKLVVRAGKDPKLG